MSGLLIDLAKAAFIAFVIGRFINPNIITDEVTFVGIAFMIIIILTAWFVHPQNEVDKEFILWNRSGS